MTSTEILLGKARETIETMNESVLKIAAQRDAARASEQAALTELGALRYRLNEFLAMIENAPLGVCPSDDEIIRKLGEYAEKRERG